MMTLPIYQMTIWIIWFINGREFPMINYKDDIEHPDDFGNSWNWLEADTGATFGPLHGTPGLCSFKTDNLTP